MKIGMVGFGKVCREILQILYRSPLIEEVLITSQNPESVISEITDLEDSLSFFHNTRKLQIYLTDYKALWACDVVVITASMPAEAGRDRMRLLEKNAQLMRQIGANFKGAPAHLKVLVVTNPVDIMAHIFLESSGLAPEKVMSSGTNLETSRLKVLLSSWSDVAIQDVQTMVLGEHGDSALIAWSLTNISGIPLTEYANIRSLPPLDKEKMLKKTKTRAWRIVENKGYTDRGIAASVIEILLAMTGQENRVLPVGSLLDGQYGLHGVLLSLPSLIGPSGRIQILEVSLSSSEKESLEQSAQILSKAKEKIS